ncbi:MAG: hypothetical protein EPN40_01655 [Rhodanobacteraceae bacterium]|nr:MAG: hypothetical protein EPN40_01655 [Rhodanobacteraceae bacterium]
MTPTALLATALTMGLFVLAGGGYAVCYSIGRLRGRIGLVRAGVACWGVAALCALAIAVLSPLETGWKLLILASALAYVAIPPMTWRYVEQLHLQRSRNP